MTAPAVRHGSVWLVLLTFITTVPGAEIWEFTGTSCPACRQMDPVVKRLMADGVPVRRIDVQQQPELARDYNVQRIPCFIAIANDRPVDRVTGVVTAERLTSMYHRASAMNSAPTIRGQSSSPGVVMGASRTADTPVNPTSACPPAACAVTTGPASHVNPYSLAQPDGVAASTAVATSPAPKSAVPIDNALAATVRIKVVDAEGHSFGTGTMIDVHDEEALVLTCGHIFRDSAGKGKIFCDLFNANGRQDMPAKLISYDLRRDIGLISFRPGVPIKTASVGGSGRRPREGDSVFAVGCSRGAAPSVIRNQIIAVNRYHGPANLVVGGRPVDGRSGGGLFDADGSLIGVCNAADQQEDEGLYAALGPIHAELDDSGLSFIYQQRQPAVAALDTQSSKSTTQIGAPRELPSPQVVDARSESEVIVILRQKNEPGAEGQAYVLDHPSDRLMHLLSGELAQRGAHQTTQMELPGEGSVSQDCRAGDDWAPLRGR